ncbi:MAG: hypothetical protein ACLP9L_14510 [Thermoguttaceae bacterium]
MNTLKVLVLSLEEARNQLADFFMALLEDEDARRELVMGGRNYIPAVGSLDASDVAKELGEVDIIGERLLDEHPEADAVFVQTDEYAYEEIAKRSDSKADNPHSSEPACSTVMDESNGNNVCTD